MKEKIIVFIIGVLVGAVLSTGAFYIYTATNKTNNNNIGMNEPPSGTPPEKPEGDEFDKIYI